MRRALAWISLVSLVSFAGWSAWAPRAAAQERGWQAYDLGGGRRATRFLPSAVRLCDPLPVAVFLHGAGGAPEAYHSHLGSHAEEIGMVLVLPQAAGAGWSGADTATIDAALTALVAEGIAIDERRTFLAGHSAGGAFAYLLAYGGSTGFASVFSMSAPFYAVDAISDPMHDAPIHMYYGADDPNYTGGSAAMLQAQWTRLGLVHETDVQPGFGHSTWPAGSIRAGLDFLMAHPYPGAPTPSTCADADAGTIDADAGASPDAGGPVEPDASTPAVDSGSAGRDSGTIRGGPISSGCSCRAAGAPRSAGRAAGLALALVGFASVARRRSRRAAS